MYERKVLLKKTVTVVDDHNYVLTALSYYIISLITKIISEQSIESI